MHRTYFFTVKPNDENKGGLLKNSTCAGKYYVVKLQSQNLKVNSGWRPGASLHNAYKLNPPALKYHMNLIWLAVQE